MTEITQPDVRRPLSRSHLMLGVAGAFFFLYLETFLLPFVPFVSDQDQVLFFARAARILHGQVLYRDFFELVTPGTDLLYAGGFLIFGIHAWVLQAWTVALGLALFCVITWIATKLFRGPLALLPGLLFLVFAYGLSLQPIHHWYSTLAALAAVGVLADGVSFRRILAAGLLCGISALFTQTQGTLAFIAVVAYLLWHKRNDSEDLGILKQLAALALPFALALLCVLGYYLHEAGFQTLYFDLVSFAPRYLSSGEVNSLQTYLHQWPPTHRLADYIYILPYLFIYAAVPYGYFVGAYQLWRKRAVLPVALREKLILLHLVGFALFVAIASGPRWFRLSTVAPPAILVCIWLISQQKPVYRYVRVLLCCMAIAFAVMLPLRRQTRWHATLDLPIGRTAFIDPYEFYEFQWFAQRTHPAEPFFNQSGMALYLALDNPTASELVNYDDFTRPEQVNALIQALRQRPPRFILYPENMHLTPDKDHSLPLREYLERNYHRTQTFWLDRHSRYEELWEPGPGSDK